MYHRIKEGTGPIHVKPKIDSEKIKHLVEVNNINNVYLPQCPGYGGFIPREPPKIELERQPATSNMTSVMKSSYREFPKTEYLPQIYGRMGPLSKTVTLTYPYNPYNNITSEETPIK